MGRASKDGSTAVAPIAFVCAVIASVIMLLVWSADTSGSGLIKGRNSQSSTKLLHNRHTGSAKNISTPGAAFQQFVGEAGSQQPAAANSSPPYRLPKLIHQTVANKSHLSCEEKAVIEGWKRLNPGYTHRLWDAQDRREFMLQHYPDLVPVPYDMFLHDVERNDFARVLIILKYGGVYADMDVQCLRPIDEWNKEHGYDAAVLLGMEEFNPTHKPYHVHVQNWVFAAMPGHPFLARMPGVIAQQCQRQYLTLARSEATLTYNVYEAGIVNRTGPGALTAALYQYFGSMGVELNKFSEADFHQGKGVSAGGVRVLPVYSMGLGMEVAVARSKRTCTDIGAAEHRALVCHMFWGSWKSRWGFRPQHTYDNCP